MYFKYIWVDKNVFNVENKVYLKLFYDLGYQYELYPLDSVDKLINYV